MTFKISSKGQITIPAASRRALGIKPHDRIQFTNNYKDHTVTIRKANLTYHNIFNHPGLNYQNYRKFCRKNGMNTDTETTGKESWNY